MGLSLGVLAHHLSKSSSLGSYHLLPEHRTNATVRCTPSAVARRETKGAAETQPLLLGLPPFFLQACPVFFASLHLGAITYILLLLLIDFFFLLFLYRTKMDAKKPSKGRLKSFPILKSKKKPNLTFGKVRVLEFHLGKKMVSLQRLGSPEPIFLTTLFHAFFAE